MPKARTDARKMSTQEWEQTPHFFGTEEALRIFGTSRRYLLEHAAQLGGVQIGGKWTWCKDRVCQMFGVDLSGLPARAQEA